MKFAPLVALAILILPGCVGRAGDDREATVLATFYPITFIAERLAADDVKIATFVPPGHSPLTYEPTVTDHVRASKARLVLYNGEGLEPWLDALRSAAPQARFVAVTANVTFVEDEGFPEDATDERADGAERHDPHVWLDPLRMRRMVNSTAAALIDLGLREEDVQARAGPLLAGLDALHVRFDEGLSRCETRHMFVTRPAYGYLVVRYNLYQHGFSTLHPGAEPTPKRLAMQIELARGHHADTVFQASDADKDLAVAFAREIGGRVLALDPVEGLTLDERRSGKNYFSVMDANLAALREGLRCR